MSPDLYFPEILNYTVKFLGFVIEYIGLVIIMGSVGVALVKLISPKYDMESVRVSLAKRIIFGLEFVIAADIILATVTVDVGEIIQLGGIVLIRVLLGYSLRKEIIG